MRNVFAILGLLCFASLAFGGHGQQIQTQRVITETKVVPVREKVQVRKFVPVVVEEERVRFQKVQVQRVVNDHGHQQFQRQQFNGHCIQQQQFHGHQSFSSPGVNVNVQTQRRGLFSRFRRR